MLAPEVIDRDVQDYEDDEKIQCKSSQVHLLECKSKQANIDPEEILQKVNLLGKIDWDSGKQQDVHNLICQYACVFSWNALDLGQTLIVKHSIKLTDPTPFKECY